MPSLPDPTLLGCLPRHFVSKSRESFRVAALPQTWHSRLLEMYLAYQPRNSFQGLPPIRDEVCAKWVQEMIRTGINLVAADGPRGLVGHLALFPIDQRVCEMLVVVSPQFQNLGIGTELVRACIAVADELRFQRIWLPVAATNVRARHVYKKCGFEYVSKQQARELEMSLDLRRVREASRVDAPAAAAVPIPLHIAPPVTSPTA